MKLASIDIFLQHYPTVLEQLEIIQNDRQLTSENRSDARSYLRALEEFDTYFGMRVFQKLLSITNPVHIQCQGRSVTVGDVRSWVTTLVSILLSQFSDDQIAIDFYQEVKQAAHYLMIDQRQLPRIPRTSRILHETLNAEANAARNTLVDQNIQDRYVIKYKQVGTNCYIFLVTTHLILYNIRYSNLR